MENVKAAFITKEEGSTKVKLITVDKTVYGNDVDSVPAFNLIKIASNCFFQ